MAEVPHRGASGTYGARVAHNRPVTPRSGNDDWPDAACDDPDAEAVRLLTLNMSRALGRSEMSMRAVAREAGLSHSVLSRLLTGEAWPDVSTVFRLERALGERLWPDHLGPA